MKKIILFGVNRHAICINDFFMFFSRSDHQIVHIFIPAGNSKNKNWWYEGKRQDAARNNVVDPIDKSKYNITEWSNINSVINTIAKMDFDYICLGNGTETDQLKLISKFGNSKMLFSEYGWLPWNSNFYISKKGCGFKSEITTFDKRYISNISINEKKLNALKKSYDRGNKLKHSNFYYVPLQKDINDFKFTFTKFKNNQQFIDFIDRIVPREYKILIKCHPLYKKKYKYNSNRIIDITNDNFNKYEIYSKMKGMICINSTSILEAILFHKKAFVYGKDIFLNKDLVEFNINNTSEFIERNSVNINSSNCNKFISLLLSRQIDRKKCISNNVNYIKNHYWNKEI